MDEYIYLGYVPDTHGIKGELRIKSKFDRKDLVFCIGKSLYFGPNKTKETIASYRKHKEFDMVTLANYQNISEVLKYLHQDVFVKRSELSLKEEEYLESDLLGCEILEDDKSYGKVVDVLHQGSNLLLEIEGAQHFYLPKQDDFIEKIDISNKKIITKNIKDLF